MFDDEISNFFNSLELKKESDISIKEGSKSLYLAEAIHKSLKLKKRFLLNINKNSIHAIIPARSRFQSNQG